MAVETLEFNYPPKSYSLQFKNLIDIKQEWVFEATMTKSGKKPIVFSYQRLISGVIIQIMNGREKKDKPLQPLKAISKLVQLIMYALKSGWKVIAKLTGITPDDQ